MWRSPIYSFSTNILEVVLQTEILSFRVPAHWKALIEAQRQTMPPYSQRAASDILRRYVYHGLLGDGHPPTLLENPDSADTGVTNE